MMSIKYTDENGNPALPANFTGTAGGGSPEIQVPTQLGPESSLNEIFAFARHHNASDVHLGAQKPVIFRQFGQLKNITAENFNAEQISSLISAALPESVMDHFEESGDAEYVHTIKGYGRFRTAIIKQRNGWDLTARLIPMDIPDFKDTGMPD